MAGKK